MGRGVPEARRQCYNSPMNSDLSGTRTTRTTTRTKMPFLGRTLCRGPTTMMIFLLLLMMMVVRSFHFVVLIILFLILRRKHFPRADVGSCCQRPHLCHMLHHHIQVAITIFTEYYSGGHYHFQRVIIIYFFHIILIIILN